MRQLKQSCSHTQQLWELSSPSLPANKNSGNCQRCTSGKETFNLKRETAENALFQLINIPTKWLNSRGFLPASLAHLYVLQHKQAAVCEAGHLRRKAGMKNKEWSMLAEYTLKHLPNRLIPTISGSWRHLMTLEPILVLQKEKTSRKQRLKRGLKT